MAIWGTVDYRIYHIAQFLCSDGLARTKFATVATMLPLLAGERAAWSQIWSDRWCCWLHTCSFHTGLFLLQGLSLARSSNLHRSPVPRLRLQRVEVEVEIPCESAAGDLPSASIAPGARQCLGHGMRWGRWPGDRLAVDDLVEAWYRNVEPVEKAEPSAQRVEGGVQRGNRWGANCSLCHWCVSWGWGRMRLRLKMRIGVVGLWWWWWLSRWRWWDERMLMRISDRSGSWDPSDSELRL